MNDGDGEAPPKSFLMPMALLYSNCRWLWLADSLLNDWVPRLIKYFLDENTNERL